MFRPTYRYTTKLVDALLRSENARAVVDALMLSPAALRDLQEAQQSGCVQAVEALDGTAAPVYRQALGAVLKKGTGPIDRPTILRLYGAMAGTEEPGYRMSNELVYDSSGADIVYVPPESDDVPGLVDDLLAWLQLAWDRVPAIVMAGISVQEIAMIRPFDVYDDGFALLVGDAILARHGYGMNGLLWPEMGLARMGESVTEARRSAHTGVYPSQADFTSWLECFSEAVAGSANEAREAVLSRSPTVAGRPEAAPNAPLYLRERQKQALEFIRLNGAIRSGQYQELVHIVPDTARRDFMDLLEKGLIVARGVGRGTHYVLTARGAELARTKG